MRQAAQGMAIPGLSPLLYWCTRLPPPRRSSWPESSGPQVGYAWQGRLPAVIPHGPSVSGYLVEVLYAWESPCSCISTAATRAGTNEASIRSGWCPVPGERRFTGSPIPACRRQWSYCFSSPAGGLPRRSRNVLDSSLLE